MSAAELKTNLHRMIDKVEDTKTLRLTYRPLAKNIKAHEDWWEHLTKKEMVAIERGLEDIENGKVHSHNEVMQELKSKFPELF